MTRWFALLFALIVLAYSLIDDGIHRGRGYHFSDQVAVLEYHHIDPNASQYTLTPEQFKAHLLALQQAHYNVITMDQFIRFLKGTGTVPPDAVLLTFDDGYESFYQYAYPLLQQQRMTATNFLIVDYLGQTRDIPFMTWEQVRKMKGDGFSFYSHTFHTHELLSDEQGRPLMALAQPVYLPSQQRMETEEEYVNRVKQDLIQAENALQKELGPQEKILCFPHGRYSKTLLEAAEQVGIHTFFTGIDGLNTPGTSLVKRINAGAIDVTPAKLLRKLEQESTVLGRMKITLKNIVNSIRTSSPPGGE